MNIKKRIILILLLIYIPSALTAQWHSGISTPVEKISAGIQEFHESIKETKELFTSINKFFTTISSAVKKVSSLVGGTTLLLLFFVLIISSGLGALGLPKGRITFFTALFISDILWLVWGSSTGAHMLSYFLMIAKTNGIVLSPFIIYLILKKFSPPLFSRLRKALPFSAGKSLHLKEAEFLTERFSDESLNLIKNISGDIETGRLNGEIFLSDASRSSLANIKKLLEKYPV